MLERSLDGVTWQPWQVNIYTIYTQCYIISTYILYLLIYSQYHAQSDEQCWLLYGMEPRPGKPSYKEDDEVICTSHYSSLKPLEGGEVSISLVNERPGEQVSCDWSTPSSPHL